MRIAIAIALAALLAACGGTRELMQQPPDVRAPGPPAEAMQPCPVAEDAEGVFPDLETGTRAEVLGVLETAATWYRHCRARNQTLREHIRETQ